MKGISATTGLIFFDIPCFLYGTPSEEHRKTLHSKNGLTYNHKKVWETFIPPKGLNIF
jgi:hypothetical protein